MRAPEKFRVEPYDLLRYGGASLILLNAFHRITFPEIPVKYISNSLIAGLPIAPVEFNFLVQLTAIALSGAILLDFRTYYTSGIMAFGVLLVTAMLSLQSPLLGLGTGRIGIQMQYFDIALRDLGLAVLFWTLAEMAAERHEKLEPHLLLSSEG